MPAQPSAAGRTVTRGATGGREAAGLRPMRHRADFLRAARARRQTMPGLVLQARRRAAAEAETEAMRVGITCSRKIGNAVTRNRARRRLRAAARAVLPGRARPGWDYVLIGRPGVTVTRPFAALCDDLARALERIHETTAP